MPSMIDAPEALIDFVERFRGSKSIALDTEFVWERTYYPRLGLVQAASEDGSCYLIDTMVLDDLTPLGELLSSPQLTKILHDAPQDLTILRRVTGAFPQTVFDTRCAAGLAGLSSTTSLAELVFEMVGVDLPKTESRTNWVRRPLTTEQIQYAAEDVLYLHALRGGLLRRVGARKRTAWLQEELALLDSHWLYRERDPQKQHWRLKGAGRASARELAILRELAAWREEEARRCNRPRARVLADGVLLQLARRKPRSRQALSAVRGMARRYEDVVLELVGRGLDKPANECPPCRPRRRPEDRERMEAQVAQAMELVRTCAAAEAIDPPFIATRGEIRSLVGEGPQPDSQRHRVLRGWRRRLVGERLLEILR